MQCAPLLVIQLRRLCSAHKRVERLQADMESIAAYQGTQQAPLHRPGGCPGCCGR